MAFCEFGAPHSFRVQHHCRGANYKQNSFHHNNAMCSKLVWWSKHVCNAVILHSHWSYTVQKQVTGARVAETETPFTLLYCTIKMFWNCYFKIDILHSVALIFCKSTSSHLYNIVQDIWSKYWYMYTAYCHTALKMWFILRPWLPALSKTHYYFHHLNLSAKC